METKTEPQQETEAPASAPPKEDEKPEDIKDRARKPPKDGKCKRCGQDKPLNRLMLCYPCWVIVNIQDTEKKAGRDWLPGIDPHPGWCQCEIIGAHPDRGLQSSAN